MSCIHYLSSIDSCLAFWRSFETPKSHSALDYTKTNGLYPSVKWLCADLTTALALARVLVIFYNTQI